MLEVINLVTSYISYIYNLMSMFIPSYAYPIILLTFSIALILMILGRR